MVSLVQVDLALQAEGTQHVTVGIADLGVVRVGVRGWCRKQEVEN